MEQVYHFHHGPTLSAAVSRGVGRDCIRAAPCQRQTAPDSSVASPASRRYQSENANRCERRKGKPGIQRICMFRYLDRRHPWPQEIPVGRLFYGYAK